jgi:hypothetical protein
MRRALATFVALGALVLGLSACGNSLALTHSETPCITPGQTVSLTTEAAPGTQLSYQVQDDFAGEISPGIAPVTIGSSGKIRVSWTSPSHLATTTIHFLLTARNGDQRTNRDVHVVVGGNGRSC